MAHVAKFTASSASKILGHCEREKSDSGFYFKYQTNSEIDTSKTDMNWGISLPDNGTSSSKERLKKRLSEVHVLNRKDVNIMCDWVLTYPHGLPHDEASLKSFFQSAFDFMSDRYGLENVISANVHMDESQPHMHFCFVPVVYDEKKDRYKVSAKDVLSKADLSSFHTALEDHLHADIGLEKGLILNGKTKEQGGNRSIQELKDSAQKLENEVKSLELKKNRLDSMTDKKQAQIDDLEAQKINQTKELYKVHATQKAVNAEILAKRDSLSQSVSTIRERIHPTYKRGNVVLSEYDFDQLLLTAESMESLKNLPRSISDNMRTQIGSLISHDSDLLREQVGILSKENVLLKDKVERLEKDLEPFLSLMIERDSRSFDRYRYDRSTDIEPEPVFEPDF